MAGGKMNCEKCGTDISMVGSQLCGVCDPDIMKIINKEVKVKSPNLCAFCYNKHLDTHKNNS